MIIKFLHWKINIFFLFIANSISKVSDLKIFSIFFTTLINFENDPFDFTFSDRDGNDVSLSDFVGSVVYVDVWATWCGPCVYEVPFLIEIEEEYEGQNITFLGVSVDTDAEAWMNFIDEKGMRGVHVNTGSWKNQMMDDYAINGIPRFMIFDTEGKVVNLNAPRPSSEKIRPILDGLLSEKWDC